MGADRLLFVDTARINFAQGREEGIEEGIAKGRSEGETNKALKIAQAMLAKGLDAETIAELTELPIDDVRKLK